MQKSKAGLNKFEPIVGIIIMIFLAVIIFAFTSCTTQRKVEKWNDKHPEEAARYAAGKWPPRSDTTINVTIDSSAYTEAMAQLYDEVYYLKEANDSLHRVISEAPDTACMKYLFALKHQQKKIAELEQKLKQLPPVVKNIDTNINQVDTFRLAALQLENARLKKEAVTNKDKLQKAEKQAAVRLWIAIASGILNLLLLVLLCYIIFQKKKFKFL